MQGRTGQIVTIHSYRGGTGKSNVTANLAWLAARQGRRIAVLDTDLQSPGVHVILGLDKNRITHTLSDFLFRKCDLEEAAYDMGAQVGLENGRGALFLLPSSMQLESILRIIDGGYDANRLNLHLSSLMEALNLDLLLIDTHPGLNRETMFTAAVSDALVVLIRPDGQDFHGTAVVVEVARRLGVPRVYLVANKVLSRFDRPAMARRIQQAFGFEVIGVLPLDEDLVRLGSRGLFARKFPERSVTKELGAITERLLRDLEEGA